MTNKDSLVHLAESLIIEGRFTKAVGSAYVDKITLVKNGDMHLFDAFKLQLSEKGIENVAKPAKATNKLELLFNLTGLIIHKV
jgi:hypothetical protein